MDHVNSLVFFILFHPTISALCFQWILLGFTSNHIQESLQPFGCRIGNIHLFFHMNLSNCTIVVNLFKCLYFIKLYMLDNSYVPHSSLFVLRGSI